VPQAIFQNVKLEERFSYPNVTKQELSVYLTTLPETPGIYLHYVCLSKGEMLAKALASGACSSSPALPPSPASPSDMAGERTEGLAPSTALSLSACPWGTGKRKYRDTIHYSTRTKGHKATFKREKEEEESKLKKNTD